MVKIKTNGKMLTKTYFRGYVEKTNVSTQLKLIEQSFYTINIYMLLVSVILLSPIFLIGSESFYVSKKEREEIKVRVIDVKVNEKIPEKIIVEIQENNSARLINIGDYTILKDSYEITDLLRKRTKLVNNLVRTSLCMYALIVFTLILVFA